MLAVSSVLFREGICKILESEKDIELISEASTQGDIITLIEQMKPDVIFIDTATPNLDIVKILDSIRENEAGTKVLLLLHNQDEEAIIHNISLGVWGCLTEASDAGEFVRAIGAITHDEIWAERKIITKAFIRHLLSLKGKPGVLKPRLTKREKEIIQLVAKGNSNKGISKKLSIREQTVKNHLQNIFHKLGISNRLDLAVNLLDEMSDLI
ncbi:MAG: LuxR C-terminal-related transcriptional regulator [Thermodesulfobacteriota bacterium]